MGIKIAIPSYKRPKIKTLDILGEFPKNDIYIFVNDAEEREAYTKANPGINVIQTNTKGITPARNFILNFFPDGERIMMLDDDILRFQVIKIIDLKKIQVDILSIKTLFEKGFEWAEKCGYKLWGVQMCGYTPAMTFKLNNDKFIIGTAAGIINNPLRFDENMKLKEDYDYTLKHIVTYGGALRMNFVTVEAVHYSNSGGCVDYRTKELEAEACQILLDRYPDRVFRNVKRENEIIIG